MLPQNLAVDLFCRVIDNYGDIGVCWRLARQLVAEHACAVRLIVDDLHAFCFLAPEVDADAAQAQRLCGVTIIPWPQSERLLPAAVVIEAFACDPPTAYVEAMAAGRPAPVWINLEYLTAEAWIDDVHGRPSPHPRLPLVKYFFCPGFTDTSGGLLREAGVATASLAPAAPVSSPLRLFAFTYPQAPVRAVAAALGHGGRIVDVSLAAPADDREQTWMRLAPVPQPAFDALLARFDVLIVRGEDSFVRAQWAARPMLWHIYPTDDNAHLGKLDAWLDRYCAGLATEAANAMREANHALVRGNRDPLAYVAFARALPALTAHALRWREALASQTDLATRLLGFAALAKSQKVG